MQGRDIAIVVGVIVLVLLLLGGMGAGMMGYGGYGGMMWPGMMGNYYGPGFGFGGLLMMLFWLLIIGGIVLLVVWAVGRGGMATLGGTRPQDSALEILKQRYARGEITKEQFDQMRRDLG